MRRFPAWSLAGFVAAAAGADAQVNLSCRLQHSRVLEYEPVRATVVVENQTSEPLYFSEEGGETALLFDVEQTPGLLVARRSEPLFPEPFVVPARQTAQRTFDLQRAYEIGRQGPYSIVARVVRGGEAFVSGKAFLDVLPGLLVLEHRATVKDPPGSHRTMRLRTLARDRMDYLFLRIDDEDRALCYGVFDLGTIIRVFKPDLKMDADDSVHVLHQSAPARFTYSAFTAGGQPLEQRFFNGTAATAKLEVAPDGTVRPVGLTPYKGDPAEAPVRVAPPPAPVRAPR
jgi:hypothetical protein